MGSGNKKRLPLSGSLGRYVIVFGFRQTVP